MEAIESFILSFTKPILNVKKLNFSIFNENNDDLIIESLTSELYLH
jgi:hypothetical protein